jgi:hypothetical protein
VDDGRKRAGQGIRDVFLQVKKGRGGFRKNTNATSFPRRREYQNCNNLIFKKTDLLSLRRLRNF